MSMYSFWCVDQVGRHTLWHSKRKSLACPEYPLTKNTVFSVALPLLRKGIEGIYKHVFGSYTSWKRHFFPCKIRCQYKNQNGPTDILEKNSCSLESIGLSKFPKIFKNLKFSCGKLVLRVYPALRVAKTRLTKDKKTTTTPTRKKNDYQQFV